MLLLPCSCQQWLWLLPFLQLPFALVRMDDIWSDVLGLDSPEELLAEERSSSD